MTVPESAREGNQLGRKSPKTAIILAILVLTASASFGLGMLAERGLSKGSVGQGRVDTAGSRTI